MGWHGEGAQGSPDSVSPGGHEAVDGGVLVRGGVAYCAHHGVPPLRQLLRTFLVRGEQVLPAGVASCREWFVAAVLRGGAPWQLGVVQL